MREITAYVTTDEKVHTDKGEAEKHQQYLDYDYWCSRTNVKHERVSHNQFATVMEWAEQDSLQNVLESR